jgi:hypothetical protein
MINGKTRKIAVIIALTLFLTFATQAILFAHLLYEGHQHDSQKCSICQQLLTLSRSITIEKQTAIKQVQLYGQNLICQIEAAPAISTLHTSAPRAPPFTR